MTAPEPCTTPARSKQHFSSTLAPDRHAPQRKGRGGKTLCGLAGAMDDERVDYLRELAQIRAGQPTSLLPLCRPCERKAATLEGARS